MPRDPRSSSPFLYPEHVPMVSSRLFTLLETIVSLRMWDVSLVRKMSKLKMAEIWGAWVARSVGHLTAAQITIWRFVGSSPALGSVLTAQSLEPASDSGLPLPYSCSVSLCFSIINKHFTKLTKKKMAEILLGGITVTLVMHLKVYT